MSDFRISQITLDEHSVLALSKPIEQEREVAICDLLESNFFRLTSSAAGPYHVTLGVSEDRLVLDVAPENAAAPDKLMLPLAPFRRVIKDYFLVCDSYYKAIRTAPPYQIEALDAGRRAVHNEGATLLQKRLEASIEMDFATARRLFTLVCVLHLKA